MPKQLTLLAQMELERKAKLKEEFAKEKTKESKLYFRKHVNKIITLWQNNKRPHWLNYNPEGGRQYAIVKAFILRCGSGDEAERVFEYALKELKTWSKHPYVDNPQPITVFFGKAQELAERYSARLEADPNLKAIDSLSQSSPVTPSPVRSVKPSQPAAPKKVSELPPPNPDPLERKPVNLLNELNSFIVTLDTMLAAVKQSDKGDMLRQFKVYTKDFMPEPEKWTPNEPFYTPSGIKVTHRVWTDDTGKILDYLILAPGYVVEMANGSFAIVLSVLDRNQVRIVEFTPEANRYYHVNDIHLKAVVVDLSKGNALKCIYTYIPPKEGGAVGVKSRVKLGYLEKGGELVKTGFNKKAIKDVSISIIVK